MNKREPQRKATPKPPVDQNENPTGSLFEAPDAIAADESGKVWEVEPQQSVTVSATAAPILSADDPLVPQIEGVGLPAVVASPLIAGQTAPVQDKSAAPSELNDYVIRTSQEVDALMRAASDGKSGSHWVTDDQAFTRSHVVPGAPHHVQIAMSEDERAAGGPLKVLEDLTLAQDPDFNFALL